MADELTAADLVTTPQFKVCGVVIDASFTYEEYGRWRDFSKEKGVSALEMRLAKAATNAGKDLRQKGAYETQEKLVNAIQGAIDKKLEQIATDFDGWTEEDEDMLSTLSVRLDAAREKLDKLEPDPEVIIGAVDQHVEAVQSLQGERRAICLEFVHSLATQRTQTKDKLAAWQKKATGQDLTNAAEVCRLGNAQFTSGAAAKRHYQPTTKTKAQLN